MVISYLCGNVANDYNASNIVMGNNEMLLILRVVMEAAIFQYGCSVRLDGCISRGFVYRGYVF